VILCHELHHCKTVSLVGKLSGCYCVPSHHMGVALKHPRHMGGACSIVVCLFVYIVRNKSRKKLRVGRNIPYDTCTSNLVIEARWMWCGYVMLSTMLVFHWYIYFSLLLYCQLDFTSTFVRHLKAIHCKLAITLFSTTRIRL